MFSCLYIFKKKKSEHLFSDKQGYFHENENRQLLGEKNIDCLEFRRERKGILPNKYGRF
jgi:hypothetical protein